MDNNMNSNSTTHHHRTNLTPIQLVALYLGSELMLRTIEREYSGSQPPSDRHIQAASCFKETIDLIIDLPHYDLPKAEAVYTLLTELPIGFDQSICATLKKVLDDLRPSKAAEERFED
jgi:hypothetical protein